jgi:hypothetical protein
MLGCWLLPFEMQPQWSEVAICFGGKLMRGNRAQKVDSSSYQVARRRGPRNWDPHGSPSSRQRLPPRLATLVARVHVLPCSRTRTSLLAGTR